MAQKREKDEPLELKVPADGPLSSLPSCPDKIPSRPDPARIDLSSAVSPDKKPLKRPRSEDHLRLDAEDPPTTKISSPSSSAVAGETAAEEEPAPKKKAVNRCTGCGKRVGLTGFKCRCGDLFCSEHRYSDRHDCTYDYKAAGREAIARENPVVKAPKIFKV